MMASPYRPQDKCPVERARVRAQRIFLSVAEREAVINLIRVVSDELADIEAGAGVPAGTLEALSDRLRSAR